MTPTDPAQAAGPAVGVGDKPPFGRAVNFLARVGVEFGGDELARAEKTSGETSTIDAGSFAMIGLGFIYQPASSYAIEMTLGYKVDRIEAGDETVEFTRYPLDVILSAASGGTRFGIGVTYHFSPTFSCNVRSFCNGDVEFEEPLGLMLQIAHTFPFASAGGFDLGARLTWLSYTIKDAPSGSGSFDGNSVGLFAGIRL